MGLFRPFNKRILLSFCFCLGFLTLGYRGQIEAAAINVKDFGAKGDGRTDDTFALQNAFNAQYHQQHSFKLGLWQATAPEIFFPKGTYIVSNMLRIRNAVILRGETQTVIKSSNPSMPVIDVHWALRVIIDGLTIEGGKTSLHLYTSNSAGAHIRIRNCTFIGTSDFAITCVMHGQLTPEGFAYSGYYRKTETEGSGYFYEYYLDPTHREIFNSTVLHVEACVFNKCMRVLHTNADMCSLDHCVIETHPDMLGAAIRASGITKLEHVAGFANIGQAREQRWIDHVGGGLICRHITLRARGQGGIPAVYTEAKFRDTSAGGAQSYVILDDCEFQVHGSSTNCILYCKEVPNIIAIRGCNEISGKEVRAIVFKTGPSRKYFRSKSGYAPISPDAIKIVLSQDNSHNINCTIPKSLSPYVDLPLPAKIANLPIPPIDVPSRSGTNSKRARIIDVTAFGAMGDGKADSSPAFQRAISEASKQTGTEVIIPNGTYLITETLILPPNISIRGQGWPYIQGTGKQRIFFVPEAQSVALSNLIIGHVAEAISIRANQEEAVSVIIDSCIFAEITKIAISCGTESMKTAENNNIRLRITDSAFYYHVHQLFETNASLALFDNSWAITDENMLGKAAIENRGVLYCMNIAGNPCSDSRLKDQRWIDNWFKVNADNFRFGGEKGGLCLVNHRSEMGHIILKNGWLYALGNEKRRSSIFLEKIPQFVALQTNTGCNGGIQKMVCLGKEARTDRRQGKWLYLSGNAIPANDPYIPCEIR